MEGKGPEETDEMKRQRRSARREREAAAMRNAQGATVDFRNVYGSAGTGANVGTGGGEGSGGGARGGDPMSVIFPNGPLGEGRGMTLQRMMRLKGMKFPK